MKYDFGGYATKHNIRCSDGRTIMPDAFEECDGQTVPLVWQHVHDTPGNVLGHALLENRSDGVYAYCSLNNTPSGQDAKEIVKHGDICALSIYANRLRQQGSNVVHGVIREVSLVLAGANPGATIDNLAIAHSDGSSEIVDDEAQMYYVEEGTLILMHADDDPDDDPEDETSEKTIEEIVDTMNDEQKAALFAIIDALGEKKEVKHSDSDEDEDSEEEDEDEDEDEEEEDEDEDDEIEHADFDSDATLAEVLDSLDDDQQAAVDAVVEALVNGDDELPDDVKDKLLSLTKEQMDAVYALVAIVFDEDEEDGEVKHADEDPTIQDVMNTMSEEQQDAVNQILDAIMTGGKSVGKDVADIFNTLNDQQKDAVYALVGLAIDKSNEGEEEVEHSDFEGEEMKFNVFDAETGDEVYLSHSDMEAIFEDAPRMGSLRDAVLAHGITDIEVLFPEAQAVNNQPYSIARRMEWVSVVLNGVHKSPFARIKSTAANLTEDQARAKGYIKGRKKIEEQIAALRRVTTPQTIYKLQKLDRDDIIDITDFDVVAWIKQEMRMMLDEEIARAILIGDGRRNADPEKIFEDHVRSVWNDDEMYTIHSTIAVADASDYGAFMDTVVRSRRDYRGSGSPTMFIDSDILTELRLLKDQDGRYRYESDQKIADAMRVSNIVEVEVMRDAVRTVDGKDHKVGAIILNLADYTLGANKGGEVSLFDDFDLDFNKYEYLIETRVSGALTMPKSAIAIEYITTTTSEADPVYVVVANPVTEDLDDYYEMDDYGRLSKTVDVAVVAGKKYYTVAE